MKFMEAKDWFKIENNKLKNFLVHEKQWPSLRMFNIQSKPIKFCFLTKFIKSLVIFVKSNSNNLMLNKLLMIDS